VGASGNGPREPADDRQVDRVLEGRHGRRDQAGMGHCKGSQILLRERQHFVVRCHPSAVAAPGSGDIADLHWRVVGSADLPKPGGSDLHCGYAADLRRRQPGHMRWRADADLWRLDAADLRRRSCSDLRTPRAANLRRYRHANLCRCSSTDLQRRNPSDMHQYHGTDMQQRQVAGLQPRRAGVHSAPSRYLYH
jgi:hypothetical protein